MNQKRIAVLDRIRDFEDAIAKGREYLATGQHGHWYGFRPLFNSKTRDGKILPAHKDWVKNVFLPRNERALRQTEKALDRLERSERERRDKSRPTRLRP